MYNWTASVDYVDGHLRYGHFEGKFTEEQYAEYMALESDAEKQEMLSELGELIIDDYRINSYGDIGEPTFF